MKPLKKEIFCTTFSEKLISLMTPYCTPRLYSPNTQKPNPVPWIQSSIPRISFSYLSCHIPTTLSGSSGWFSKSSQGFPIEHWLMALSLDFIQQLWRKTRMVSSRCGSTCRGFFCLCYAQNYKPYRFQQNGINLKDWPQTVKLLTAWSSVGFVSVFSFINFSHIKAFYKREADKK